MRVTILQIVLTLPRRLRLLRLFFFFFLSDFFLSDFFLSDFFLFDYESWDPDNIMGLETRDHNTAADAHKKRRTTWSIVPSSCRISYHPSLQHPPYHSYPPHRLLDHIDPQRLRHPRRPRLVVQQHGLVPIWRHINDVVSDGSRIERYYCNTQWITHLRQSRDCSSKQQCCRW